MFLLKLIEPEREHNIGIFQTLEGIKIFLSKIKGFKFYKDESCILGKLNVSKLDDYEEIKYENKIFPLTRFAFKDDAAEAIAVELENFDDHNKNSVEGQTYVDAYVIENSELQNYIKMREENFKRLKTELESLGFAVYREYHGSEDGEAVTYQNSKGEFKFLMHLDPDFVYDFPATANALADFVRAETGFNNSSF